MEEPSQPLQAAVVQFAHLELANSEIDEAAVEAARKERQEAEDTERERAPRLVRLFVYSIPPPDRLSAVIGHRVTRESIWGLGSPVRQLSRAADRL